MSGVVALKRQGKLLQMIRALRASRRLSRRLHRRQQQGNKNPNDRNDHQKFHQRERTLRSIRHRFSHQNQTTITGYRMRTDEAITAKEYPPCDRRVMVEGERCGQRGRCAGKGQTD